MVPLLEKLKKIPATTFQIQKNNNKKQIKLLRQHKAIMTARRRHPTCRQQTTTKNSSLQVIIKYLQLKRGGQTQVDTTTDRQVTGFLETSNIELAMVDHCRRHADVYGDMGDNDVEVHRDDFQACIHTYRHRYLCISPAK